MDGDGVAYEVQAITFTHQKKTDHIFGALVCCFTPNPMEGPHDLIITTTNEEGKFAVQVVYESELLDRDTSEPVSWLEVDTDTCYNFMAKGLTGWIRQD